MWNALKSKEWGRKIVHKTFKIDIKKGGGGGGKKITPFAKMGGGGAGVGQIIHTFCKIGSCQKLGPPSLIWRNLKTLKKLLLNHEECIEI